MEIRRNRVVALEYTLKDDAGAVIDRSGKELLYYLHGHSNIVPGLEEALEGKAAGESLSVSVPPEKGYGSRDPKLVSKVPIARLPEGSTPMKGQRYSIQMGNQTRNGSQTRRCTSTSRCGRCAKPPRVSSSITTRTHRMLITE
jgi:FKBP-type peptidyl-prolyl cis-trans isomerase SlyD